MVLSTNGWLCDGYQYMRKFRRLYLDMLLQQAGGYKALAVWDSSLTCGNGVCSTFVTPRPRATLQFRDLQGNVTAIQPNSQISISAKPILLENQNPPL